MFENIWIISGVTLAIGYTIGILSISLIASGKNEDLVKNDYFDPPENDDGQSEANNKTETEQKFNIARKTA